MARGTIPMHDAARPAATCGGRPFPRPVAADPRPLRILHVVDSLEFGGLERVVTDLAIAQQARGHNVGVLSILDTRGFRDVLEAAGIPVDVAGKQSAMDLSVLRRIRDVVRARHVDVVHTHNFVPNYYAAAATRFAGGRHVLVNTCHNMGSRLAGRKLRWLYRISLRATARVALVGDMVRDHLVATGIVPAARATAVFNGIPTARFGPDPLRRALARTALGVSPDTVLLGCVGRLVELKNHRFLLERMPALCRVHPGIALVLVGGGPLEDELRAHADALGLGDRVRILGARTDTAELLSAMDVFVLPSLTEGLSIALLEACAAGLPVVATAVGGNPEIVTDAVTGRLVEPGDAGALHDALLELATDAGMRHRLGDSARRWVEAHGSVEAMQQCYHALYLDALDGAAAPA